MPMSDKALGGSDLDHALLARGHVALQLDGPVATVSLNRPEVRNAQLPETWEALAHIGSRLPDDIRVVIVCGEGPSFSAGLDRSAFAPDPTRCWAAWPPRRPPWPTRRSPDFSADSAGWPIRGSSRSPPSPGTRSAPGSSWRWPAT